MKALCGGVQIVVPPGLAVEVHGTAIMGGFQNVNRAPAHPDPDAPLLRVRGLAVMGGVEITMRLPGESEHQAHRRRRSNRAGSGARCATSAGKTAVTSAPSIASATSRRSCSFSRCSRWRSRRPFFMGSTASWVASPPRSG